jgi:hypothetical protein
MLQYDDKTKHVWQGAIAGLSGHWTCVLCGHFVTGGPHDGGPYYPGRGQDVPECDAYEGIASMVLHVLQKIEEVKKKNEHKHTWTYDVKLNQWECETCHAKKQEWMMKQCAFCHHGIDECVSYSQHFHDRCAPDNIKFPGGK